MKSKASIFIGLAALALFAYGVNRYILSGPRSPLIGFRPEIQSAYEAVKLGDSLAQVNQRLGVPRKTGTTLLLPQTQGFENEFRKAEESNAKIYYLWINGGNWYYSIGFDSSDRVVIKAEGNS